MSRCTQSWTERDDAILAKLYPTYGVTVCKERLGRTAAAVYARAFQLGLTGRQAGTKAQDAPRAAARR